MKEKAANYFCKAFTLTLLRVGALKTFSVAVAYLGKHGMSPTVPKNLDSRESRDAATEREKTQLLLSKIIIKAKRGHTPKAVSSPRSANLNTQAVAYDAIYAPSSNSLV